MVRRGTSVPSVPTNNQWPISNILFDKVAPIASGTPFDERRPGHGVDEVLGENVASLVDESTKES
jgi:hypothetical protein